jgi:hypothetical protein
MAKKGILDRIHVEWNDIVGLWDTFSKPGPSGHRLGTAAARATLCKDKTNYLHDARAFKTELFLQAEPENSSSLT